MSVERRWRRSRLHVCCWPPRQLDRVPADPEFPVGGAQYHVAMLDLPTEVCVVRGISGRGDGQLAEVF